MAEGAPFPVRDPIGDTPVRDKDNRVTGWLVNERWRVWLRGLRQAVDASPTRVRAPLEVPGQNAAIGVTAIPTEALAPGYYRVSVLGVITAAAVTSSSLTVTITWSYGGVTHTASTPAITGNTVGANTNPNGTFVVQIDQATPISYSTAYASNGAGEMEYDLSVLLEALG